MLALLSKGGRMAGKDIIMIRQQDISILPGIGHFYFALTYVQFPIAFWRATLYIQICKLQISWVPSTGERSK